VSGPAPRDAPEAPAPRDGVVAMGWTRRTAARDADGQKVRSTAPQACPLEVLRALRRPLQRALGRRDLGHWKPRLPRPSRGRGVAPRGRRVHRPCLGGTLGTTPDRSSPTSNSEGRQGRTNGAKLQGKSCGTSLTLRTTSSDFRPGTEFINGHAGLAPSAACGRTSSGRRRAGTRHTRTTSAARPVQTLLRRDASLFRRGQDIKPPVAPAAGGSLSNRWRAPR
jgi:hypothetical protein